MLDMIEIYGPQEGDQNLWRELPTDYDNWIRLERFIRRGVELQPATSELPAAAVLRGSFIDSRYRIGRLRDSGAPQYLDMRLMVADGQFAIKLLEESILVFLLPPVSTESESITIGQIAAKVSLDDDKFINLPLYW